MKLFPQRQIQNFSIRSLLERREEIYGRKKKPKPGQISSAKAILAGKDLVKFWKIHAAIMGLLYIIGILLGSRTGDYEFVITARSSKTMWMDIICTQFLFWAHVCNTVIALIYLGIISKHIKSAWGSDEVIGVMKKCRKSIILIIFSSLTFYSIIACYREHNDVATLNICPVIIFILFSHLSSLIFKIDFYRKMEVLKKITLSLSKKG